MPVSSYVILEEIVELPEILIKINPIKAEKARQITDRIKPNHLPFSHKNTCKAIIKITGNVIIGKRKNSTKILEKTVISI